MAATLGALEKDLARALAGGDPETIASVRRTIGDTHPETEAGAEANFRLGLTALFAGQSLEEAEARLRLAAKAKSKRWSPHARVSLGLILQRQGKTQQALFELRKVAGAAPPTLVAAQALAWMGVVHTEAGQPAEAEKSRAQMMDALAKLAKSPEAEVAAQAAFMFGMELKSEGKRQPAKAHLSAALASGRLGEDEVRTAEAALAEL